VVRELSALEARVLGVLVEKERTVPDAYPLSLNALVSGCNQKTSRNPVMNAAEAEVLAAIGSLKGLSLVIESSGGRVMRYAQNAKRVLQVPTESVALLAMLMLRGPQTAAELRANSERLCRFSDVSAVEGFLGELAQRAAGTLVQELPRQAGSREARWMHCLCGTPEIVQGAAKPSPAAPLQVDSPEVVAELQALAAALEAARAGHDAPALEALLWQSPRALHENGTGGMQVRTFGRDFAVTSAPVAGDGRKDSELLVWVRFAQGWRIVAVHRTGTPAEPAAAG
jgi:uncharacterized protein YceH (UPF0502 family)